MDIHIQSDSQRGHMALNTKGAYNMASKYPQTMPVTVLSDSGCNVNTQQ